MKTQLLTTALLVFATFSAASAQAGIFRLNCQGNFFADQGEQAGDEFEGGFVDSRWSVQAPADGKSSITGITQYQGQDGRRFQINQQLATSLEQGNVASGVGTGKAAEVWRSELKLGNLGSDGKTVYASLSEIDEKGMRLRSALKCELAQ